MTVAVLSVDVRGSGVWWDKIKKGAAIIAGSGTGYPQTATTRHAGSASCSPLGL